MHESNIEYPQTCSSLWPLHFKKIKFEKQWRRQVSEFGGAFEAQHAFWGAQDRISRNLPSPSLPKFLNPWIFSEIFSRTFLIFFQTFKNCPGLPKFFTDLPKIFPRPTKNVIFLATFHKFLQFCLSNSDVSTTFGHFSQKSPLCRCGSYTHGSQRLMVSTEIIKNWGGKMGEQRIIFGGHFPPPPPRCPPSGAATVEKRNILKTPDMD